MSLIRMDIQWVVAGSGPVASVVVLRPHDESSAATKLPIRIGSVEAAALTMGIDKRMQIRPKTHDLMKDIISQLGAKVSDVVITDVRDTTFYALVRLITSKGELVVVDARPSDALALAVRTHVPIFADSEVLETAGLPDFDTIERDERTREEVAFHNFVEGLEPEDFS